MTRAPGAECGALRASDGRPTSLAHHSPGPNELLEHTLPLDPQTPTAPVCLHNGRLEMTTMYTSRLTVHKIGVILTVWCCVVVILLSLVRVWAYRWERAQNTVSLLFSYIYLYGNTLD